MNAYSNAYNETISAVQQYLKYIRALGCSDLPCTDKVLGILSSWDSPVRQMKDRPSKEAYTFGDCRRCGLADERETAVFGEGPETARLMFVGGYPEAADADSGRPYSGRAGDLLTRIIEAIKLTRQEVYICHSVKCRPSGNREPNRFEARACRKHLEHQIKTVRPDIICVLGEFASRILLDADKPMSKIHGRFYEMDGVQVMPTYDPEYLLADPSVKRAVWEDMKKIMRICEKPNST